MDAKNLMFKELQKEVHEGNQQLDLIFNSLPQSLALVTPNFEILRVNKNFLSLYGVNNSDVIGKKCHEACFGLKEVCDGCLVKRALLSKKTEKKIKSFPTGEVCEMTAQPVFNEKGEVTHVLDMRTNITETKKYENELIESRENAERASKLKSVFLANMSHEIRTPLNAIIGFSNFVIEEELDDSTKVELKKEIKSNSDYLLSTIGNIMEISQIESGNRHAKIEPFDFRLLMTNIFSENQNHCPSDVSFNLNNNIPANIIQLNSDKGLIKQIVTRFIDNAFKFTTKGEVEFGITEIEPEAAYEFYVKDTGIGIEPDRIDELFEPFHQLNPMVKGVGIGLSICKAHAALLKTKIEVESEPKKGSIFKFRINN